MEESDYQVCTKNCAHEVGAQARVPVDEVARCKQDPDVWILQLEDLQARLKDMNAAISDDNFYVHILNNLPAEYEVQVSKLEERFGSTTNSLTIQDLRNELNLKYTQLKHISAEWTETDQALATSRQYKGKCTNCGKMGHKASECCS